MKCIPTYKVGAREQLMHLKREARDGSWGPKLDIVGMGFDGVGLGDCVTGAKMVALKLSG